MIDNCEHLIEPVAAIVAELLRWAPGVRILATSREPLGILGEAIAALPPLDLPAPDSSLDEALRTAAVRLLRDRAAVVNPAFAVNDETLPAVIEIVRRLDGLPLAIELAAARMRVLPAHEIARRLSDRFRLLTGGNRSSLPRHRTLRAVVEWSWDLLTPAERVLAERLAVFPAGTTAERAVAICADDVLPAADIPDLLISLVDRSLLHTVDGHELRFRMLETIREYGVDRLTEQGRITAARQAHAEHFAALAIESEPRLRTRDQIEALAVLNAERDNILAALRYLGDSGQGGLALKVALSLFWYWTVLASSSECLTWMNYVLEINRDSDEPQLVYAEAVQALAGLESTSAAGGTDWESARAEILAVNQRLVTAPRPWFVSLATLRPTLGFFVSDGKFDSEQSDQLLIGANPTADDRWLAAAINAGRANVAENDGRLDDMRRYADLAYADFAEIGDRWGMSTSLAVRGQLATLDGDLEAAASHFSEALSHVQQLGSDDDDLYLHLRLVEVHRRRGDADAARYHLGRIRSAADSHPGDAHRLLFADSALATLLIQEGDLERASEIAISLRAELDALGGPQRRTGHTYAIVLGIVGFIAQQTGDYAQAQADLTTAFPIAVDVQDMPILAAIGVAIGALAGSLGREEDAAEILGAAARLRGSADQTDWALLRIEEQLRNSLGDRFDIRYQQGRSLTREAAIRRLDPTLINW